MRIARLEPFRIFLPGEGGTLDEVLHLVELRWPGVPVERVAPVR